MDPRQGGEGDDPAAPADGGGEEPFDEDLIDFDGAAEEEDLPTGLVKQVPRIPPNPQAGDGSPAAERHRQIGLEELRPPAQSVAVYFTPLQLVPVKYANQTLSPNGPSVAPIGERRAMILDEISKRNIAHGGVREDYPYKGCIGVMAPEDVMKNINYAAASRWAKATVAKLRVTTGTAQLVAKNTYYIGPPVQLNPQARIFIDDKANAPMLVMDGAPVFGSTIPFRPDGNFSERTNDAVRYVIRELLRIVEREVSTDKNYVPLPSEKVPRPGPDHDRRHQQLTMAPGAQVDAQCLGFKVLGFAGTPSAVRDKMLMLEPPRIVVTIHNAKLAEKCVRPASRAEVSEYLRCDRLLELSKARKLQFQTCPITMSPVDAAPPLHKCAQFTLAVHQDTAALPLSEIIKSVAQDDREVALIYNFCTYDVGKTTPPAEVLQVLVHEDKAAAWEAAMSPAAAGTGHPKYETLKYSVSIGDPAREGTLWRVRPPEDLAARRRFRKNLVGCKRHRLLAHFAHRNADCPGRGWQPTVVQPDPASAQPAAAAAAENDPLAAAAAGAGSAAPGSNPAGRGGCGGGRGQNRGPRPGAGGAGAGRGAGGKRTTEAPDPRDAFFSKRPRALARSTRRCRPGAPHPDGDGGGSSLGDRRGPGAGRGLAALVPEAASAAEGPPGRGRATRGRGRGRGGGSHSEQRQQAGQEPGFHFSPPVQGGLPGFTMPTSSLQLAQQMQVNQAMAMFLGASLAAQQQGRS
eukprot:tig00000190_g13854.t1